MMVALIFLSLKMYLFPPLFLNGSFAGSTEFWALFSFQYVSNCHYLKGEISYISLVGSSCHVHFFISYSFFSPRRLELIDDVIFKVFFLSSCFLLFFFLERV